MTFVRAEMMDTGPVVYADWYITDPERGIRSDREHPELLNGDLKLLLLSSQVAVAYASGGGARGRALEVIRRIYDRGWCSDVDRCLRELEATSRECSADFALLAMGSSHRIYEIKGGPARATSAAWLGSHEAFSMFQRKRAEVATQVEDTRSVLGQAFEHVVYAGLADVAGPAVCIAPINGRLKYAQNAKVYGGYNVQTIPSRQPTPIEFGTAADGAYEFSMFGSEDQPILAMYFSLGKFGAVVAPLHSESRLITIPAPTQEQFRLRVQEHYGAEVDLGITYA